MDSTSVYERLFDVRDLRAVVTGAASGLGFAMAEVLADCGARVTLADIDAERLESVTAPLVERGAAARSFVVDVSDEGRVQALIDDVVEAEDGEGVVPGQVLIAPAGRHMKLRKRGAAVRILLDEEPRGSLHRPSVDVLMTSVARVYGPRALGVVLTGMGADGVEGLRAIQAAGGRTLAESEETCVIYGMPKAAVEAGVVERSVPLGRLAAEILAAV